MRRRRAVAVVGLCVGLIGLGAVALAGGTSSGSSDSFTRCPHGALHLHPDSIAPASRVALAEEPADARPRVTDVVIASTASTRADYVKSRCGGEGWRRTIVVTIDRRAYHPSASASLGVYAVSRFADGYRVWIQLH